MILVPTAIKADSTSLGVYYPRDVLDDLLSSEIEVCGAFNIEPKARRLEESAHWIAAKAEFKLVGFDLINDTLYAKIDGDESVLDRIAEGDYRVKFIINGKHERRNDLMTLIEIESIRGVSLVEQYNETVS